MISTDCKDSPPNLIHRWAGYSKVVGNMSAAAVAKIAVMISGFCNLRQFSSGTAATTKNVITPRIMASSCLFTK